MKIIKKYGHQGDLNFRKVDKVPEGFKKVSRDEFDKARGGYTLALGEHSGHAHTLIERKENTFEVYKDSEGRHCLVIHEDTELLHGTFVAPAKINTEEKDKHDMVIFKPGVYIQDYEDAYDPFLKTIQRVID